MLQVCLRQYMRLIKGMKYIFLKRMRSVVKVIYYRKGRCNITNARDVEELFQAVIATGSSFTAVFIRTRIRM